MSVRRVLARLLLAMAAAVLAAACGTTAPVPSTVILEPNPSEGGWWMIRPSPIVQDRSADGPAPPERYLVPTDVLFDVDSSVIKAGQTYRLADLAETISADGRSVVIVGHTDSTGSSDYNLQLGMDRAVAVAELLEHLGVSENQIAVLASRGEDCPVEDNKSPMGRAANRRVEIIVGDVDPGCPVA